MKKIFLLFLILCIAVPVFAGEQSTYFKKKAAPAGGGPDIAYSASTTWSVCGAASNTKAAGSTMDLAVGDLVTVFVRSASSTSTTVTDDATTPNTYTGSSTIWFLTGEGYGQTFTSKITTAKTGATITADFGTSVSWAMVGAAKFTGSFTTKDKDVDYDNNTWAGSGVTITPAWMTGTLAQTKELLIGWGTAGGGTTTQDAAWTTPGSLTPGACGFAGYKIVNATTDTEWRPTNTGNNTNCSVIVTYKAN